MRERGFEQLPDETGNEGEKAPNGELRPVGIEKGPETKAQKYTVLGTAEIKPDTPPENFAEAVAESAEMQAVLASQKKSEASPEGRKGKVGRVALAAMGLLALVAASPMKAEAGGYQQRVTQTERFDRTPTGYKQENTTTYRAGPSYSWRDIAKGAASQAAYGVLSNIFSGGGGNGYPQRMERYDPAPGFGVDEQGPYTISPDGVYKNYHMRVGPHGERYMIVDQFGNPQ